MIIQRQYVPFRILAETDPISIPAIDKGFYDITMPASESTSLKHYNLSYDNSLRTIEMGSGVPFPDRMAAAFKELDLTYPYDNGYTPKDIARREVWSNEDGSLNKVTAYDKHNHIIAVNYYGDQYKVAREESRRDFLDEDGLPRRILDHDVSGEHNPQQQKFVFFWHEYQKNGYLSNWAKTPFTIEGVRYQHMEQYIMAKKALIFKDLEAYEKIMAEEDPGKIKKLGRTVENFFQPTWDGALREILHQGLLAKFRDNYKIGKLLLETGDAYLVEASPYDDIYGIKMHADDPDAENPCKWKGKNLLGYALMEVREELKTKLMMDNLSKMWLYLDNLDRPAPFLIGPREKQDIRDFLEHIMGMMPDNLLIV